MTGDEGSQVVTARAEKMRRRTGIGGGVFLGTALIGMSAFAAEVDERLTLEAAVDIAHAQARGILLSKADVLLMDVERLRALNAYLPSFDVFITAGEQFRGQPINEFRGPVFCDSSLSNLGDCSSTNDFVEGPFVDRRQLNNASEPRFTLRVTANQLVWDGGRAWAVIQRNGDLRARSKSLLRRVRNDLRLSVARTFYGYERAERTRSAFDLRVERSEAQLALEKKRRQEGKGSDADIAVAERNLAEDRLNLARRQLNVSRARRALNLTMGRRADIPVKLSIPPSVTSTAPLDHVAMPNQRVAEKMALSRRPELVAQRHLVEVRQRDIDIQAAAFQPRVTLGASYRRASRRPGRVFDDPTQNYRASLDLTVRWRLLAPMVNAYVGTQVTELQLAKTVADLEDLERRLTAEAHDRLESLEVRIQVYELARYGLKSAASAVELARKRFEAGKVTALELRDAELKYTQAQVSTVNARLDIEIGKEELRRALGGAL